MDRHLEPPLFTFGVIADVQYADIDDGHNYTRTRRRYYRSSLRLLENAVTAWSESAAKPDFVIQLGDVIDGFNKPRGASERALDAVLREFGRAPCPVHHVWGNHDLYNFSRDELTQSRLDSSAHADAAPGAMPARADVYAYRFSPFPGFCFVLMDAYDVSLLGVPDCSERHQKALELIRRHNQNQDLNCPPEDAGRSRFTMFNGGFSKEQLDWLDSVLTTADQRAERVTIVSHLPTHPSCTDSICLAWNFPELLEVIRSHHSVVCYMAGHAHDGSYCRDGESGVHHLTVDGVIETPPDSDAFATVSVFHDRMELKGSGQVTDRVLHFPQKVT